MQTTESDTIGITHLQMFEDIIEDGKQPRSIEEIKQKYELSFPFQVKRVVEGKATHAPGSEKIGYIQTVPGITMHLVGPIVDGTEHYYDDEFGGLGATYPMWVFYS